VHSTADLDVLSRVEVQYVTLPGWQSSITETKNVTALPENCQKYLKFIESFLDVPIEWIGVGPRRESMLKVSDSTLKK
jgi:adenylosuccinate synthase